jgi:thioredoxin reductase
LAEEIQAMVSYNDTIYETRKIKKFTQRPKSLVIEFEDGDTKEESFLVHQASTRVNRASVEQLGLELNERGDIVTKMPFYQTNIGGVFAAGDCASPFKIIANAVLMGANAGAGIARELPARVTGNEVDRLI